MDPQRLQEIKGCRLAHRASAVSLKMRVLQITPGKDSPRNAGATKPIGSVLPVSFYWLVCPFSGRRTTSTGFLQRRRTRRDVLPITTCSSIPCP